MKHSEELERPAEWLRRFDEQDGSYHDRDRANKPHDPSALIVRRLRSRCGVNIETLRVHACALQAGSADSFANFR